jgi:hypothetical protein
VAAPFFDIGVSYKDAKRNNTMKKLMIIAALVLSVSASAFASKPSNGVKVLSTNMDVVYLKVSCDMIGAEIEIHDEKGNVIFTASVTEKKVLIDFYAEPSGEYTIVVKKNTKEESISYSKSTVSQSELASHNFITVTQM